MWSEGHVSGVIRDGLCAKDLWIDEGSQWAIHEHACVIYLSGSGNRKARRAGGSLGQDENSSGHVNGG